MTVAQLPSTVTLDLIRLVAFVLGFLLCGLLARLAWDAYRTRAQTRANGLVLTGVTAFCLGTAAVVIASLSHVTDKVHRQNVAWISPLLIGAFVVMAVGLALVIRGQRSRLSSGDGATVLGPPRRPLASQDHPLDEMTADIRGRNGAE